MSGNSTGSSTGTGTGAGTGPIRAMLEAAEQMSRAARAWNPQGMVEVYNMYLQWPQVLAELTRAWALMHARAQNEYPVKPVVAQLVGEVHRTQRVAANAAEQIGPTFRAAHREDFDRLADRRNAMWDLRANQGVQ